MGSKTLKHLTNSLTDNHRNTNRWPKHSLSFAEYVVRFLLSYVEQNALLLSGYSRSDILPSSISKSVIWKTYNCAAQEKGDIHAVAYTIFCRLWRLLLPSVIIMKPMTDLCWTWHQNSTAILRAANSSEMSKSTNLAETEKHLRIVQIERSFYKTTFRKKSDLTSWLMENSSCHFCPQGSLLTPTTSKHTLQDH